MLCTIPIPQSVSLCYGKECSWGKVAAESKSSTGKKKREKRQKMVSALCQIWQMLNVPMT